jgi:hypothetical protein
LLNKKYSKEVKERKLSEIREYASDVYEIKTISDSLSEIYKVSKILSLISSTISVITGVACVAIILQNLEVNIYISGVIALVFITLMEKIKRSALDRFSISMYRDRAANIVIVIAVMLTTSLSLLLSYTGGIELVEYYKENREPKEILVSTRDSVKVEDAKIEALLAEKAKVLEKQRYRGKLTKAGGLQVVALDKRISILNDEKERISDFYKKQYENEYIGEVEKHNNLLSKIKLILLSITLISELIVILSILFQHYYLFNASRE